MKINCLVIDDEPLAREGLARYVKDIDFLQLIDTLESSLESRPVMDDQTIDLIFLDIQMPKLTGLEFLKSLKNPPMVVLTTAYPQYALEGFQLDVLDYLLKPITFERFYQTANRAKDYYTMQQKAQATILPPVDTFAEASGHFFIKVDHKYERINIHDILFVEGMQNYVKIHTKAQTYMTLLTLKSVEEKLPEDRFMRIHKSYLIAKDKVSALEGNQLMVGKDKLTISRNYRDEVKKKLLQENLLNGKK